CCGISSLRVVLSSYCCLVGYAGFLIPMFFFFFFSSRRRHTRSTRDWSSDVCSSDLEKLLLIGYKAETSIADATRALVERRPSLRSEERRVGKECRSGWWRYH